MYYNNKSTFYVKQYGPTVLIIVISVLLIFVGVYAYLSSTKLNTKQNELVAKKLMNQMLILRKTLK